MGGHKYACIGVLFVGKDSPRVPFYVGIKDKTQEETARGIKSMVAEIHDHYG